MTAIRLLLADDQALIRGALVALLSLEPDIDVVVEVERGDEVLDAVRRHPVDVALLDLEMPGMNGIEVVAELAEAAPSVRCLIVTTFGRPGYLRRALDAGAAGFVVKDTPASELVDAVRRVNAGLRVVDPELATESLIAGTNPLSQREQEVLARALTGVPVAEIARLLALTAGTVRNYLSTATAKTHARSSAEAAVIARDRGWL
ncbi:MAG: response regulator transcription factor [Acidimicrobiales bacterium]